LDPPSYVGSCLPMLWGSLLVASSRCKHPINNFPTFEDWTDRLSRNTGKLPTYIMLTTQKTASTPKWKPEIPKTSHSS
jgi:hypothetical protein